MLSDGARRDHDLELSKLEGGDVRMGAEQCTGSIKSDEPSVHML